MLFRNEEIVKAIDKLISNEAIEIMVSQTKYLFKHPKDDNQEKRDHLAAKIKQRTTNINYLKELRARIKERPSEKELIALLNEIEGLPIQLGFQTFTPSQLVNKEEWMPSHRKSTEKSPPPKDVRFYHQKKLPHEALPRPVEQLKCIRDTLNHQLASLEYSEKTQGALYIGEDDESGQINSPGIQTFIANSRTTNKEKFRDDTSPAIVDLNRDIMLDGRNYPKPKFSEETIRKELRAFLETSEKFRNREQAKGALCNAILKNGQGLQELFVYEYSPENPEGCPLTIGDKFYMMAHNNTLYNWTINSEGDLCMDIELDVKSVLPLSEPTSLPFILDNKTGEFRPFDDDDDIGNCPTIIKYKASIVFDVKSSAPAYKTVAQFQATKGTPSVTEAIPRVISFNVSVYSDKAHYTPQLTRFAELGVMPQEKPAPGNN